MAYWRVITKGGLGTVETWSTSVAFGVIGLSPDTPLQQLTDDMALAIRNATTSTNVTTALLTLMSGQGYIDTIRVERRAEDDTILNVAESLLAAPLSGSGTATKTPQDALVFSLRTATPGPTGRGRMYWPALGATLSASFGLTGPTPAAVVAGAKTWLTSTNTAMDSVYAAQGQGLRVALSVRSLKNNVTRAVTSIQVGSVLDTQRRRRDLLPESYVTTAYP